MSATDGRSGTTPPPASSSNSPKRPAPSAVEQKMERKRARIAAARKRAIEKEEEVARGRQELAHFTLHAGGDAVPVLYDCVSRYMEWRLLQRKSLADDSADDSADNSFDAWLQDEAELDAVIWKDTTTKHTLRSILTRVRNPETQRHAYLALYRVHMAGRPATVGEKRQIEARRAAHEHWRKLILSHSNVLLPLLGGDSGIAHGALRSDHSNAEELRTLAPDDTLLFEDI